MNYLKKKIRLIGLFSITIGLIIISNNPIVKKERKIYMINITLESNNISFLYISITSFKF